MTLRDISEAFLEFVRKRMISLFFVFFFIFIALILYINSFKINSIKEDVDISIFNQNKLNELKENLINQIRSPYIQHKYTIQNNDSIEKILSSFNIKKQEVKFITTKLKEK